jgi:hypothetical protein
MSRKAARPANARLAADPLIRILNFIGVKDRSSYSRRDTEDN